MIKPCFECGVDYETPESGCHEFDFRGRMVRVNAVSTCARCAKKLFLEHFDSWSERIKVEDGKVTVDWLKIIEDLAVFHESHLVEIRLGLLLKNLGVISSDKSGFVAIHEPGMIVRLFTQGYSFTRREDAIAFCQAMDKYHSGSEYRAGKLEMINGTPVAMGNKIIRYAFKRLGEIGLPRDIILSWGAPDDKPWSREAIDVVIESVWRRIIQHALDQAVPGWKLAEDQEVVSLTEPVLIKIVMGSSVDTIRVAIINKRLEIFTQ